MLFRIEILNSLKIGGLETFCVLAAVILNYPGTADSGRFLR